MDFRILGPLEARDGDRVLDLGGARQRALLALLVLNANEVVSSDRLVEQLWPSDGSSGGSKALQVAVSRLRRTLEPDRKSAGQSRLLVTRPPGYELCLEPGQLDLHRFEEQVEVARRASASGDSAAAAQRLDEALGLWRGAPLADLAYESFAQEAIARLEELRAAVLEDRVAAMLELGRHAQLVGELQALTRRYPLRERLREQLMLALYRSGRQADALAVYREARAELVDQLGIEPGTGLQELERAILGQDPALVEPARRRNDPVEDPAGTLVGRTRELDALLRGLDLARSGSGGVFLLSGEAGIGKSRLLEELARHGRERGADVLWGRCWEAGGAPAYWPWVQSLRAYVRSREPEALRRELATGGEGLIQLLPELRELLTDPPDEPPPDSEGARFRLFDSVASFLLAAARAKPLVLVFDDLHAADEPSLLLLRFVARQVGDAPLLVAGGYRDIELERDASRAAHVAELARERAVHRLPLAGLEESEVERLIESSAGARPPPRSVAAIYRGTEGNPLFVGEVVRLLAAEGRLDDASREASEALLDAPGVREVIGRRLQGLSENCRGIISLAAVLGREFDFDALACVSQRPEEELLIALDEALAVRVVADVPGAPGRLRFAHALIRDSLYAGLGGARRSRLHGQVGEALEALYADGREPHLAELAHHFVAAGSAAGRGRAVEYAQGAADRAMGLLAFEEAVRLYGMAVGTLEREGTGDAVAVAELLIALANAHARAGAGPEAKAAFLRAAELARRAGLPELLAHAAVGYGGRFVWHRALSDEHLVPLLEDALVGLGEADGAMRVQILSRLAAALRGEPSHERREGLGEEAIAVARRLGDPATLTYALTAADSGLSGLHPPERWLEMADEIISLAEGTGDDERLFDGHEHAVWAAWQLGDADRRGAAVAAMARVAQELRQPAQMWCTGTVESAIALATGRFGEAEELIARTLAVGAPSLGWDAAAARTMELYVLRREQGRLGDYASEVGDSAAFYSPLLRRCVQAHVSAVLGRAAQAEEILEDLAGRDLANFHRDEEWLLSVCVLAEACVHLRATDDAPRLYELLLPHGRLNAVATGDLGIDSVSRPLGMLATLLGRLEDAERHFEEALRMNKRMGAEPWIAHTEEEYARMLAMRGGGRDGVRALELAAAAGERYRRLGMQTFADGAARLEREFA